MDSHQIASIQVLGQTCQFELEPYVIQLKNAFGTSHSVTTSRKNALLSIKILGEEGNSECGLPPKKAYCYYSDYHDVETFFNEFLELVITKAIEKNPFQQFQDSQYFPLFFVEDNKLERAVFFQLLNMLDLMPGKKEYLAPKALFECAAFDWYGKVSQRSVCEMIAPAMSKKYSQEHLIPSCYTLSLLDNIEEVLQLIGRGLESTPYLKIKVGNDLDYVEKILNGIYERVIRHQDYIGFLCCDCNSSWTVDLCLEFAERLKSSLKDLRPFMYMLEQPFPLRFLDEGDLARWMELKQVYRELGVEIIADESVATKEDVVALAPYSTGVNVKIEKSGGFRGAIASFIAADKYGLHKWVGIMIGSSLNSTQAGHIACFATRGVDLDGPLHIEASSERFSCGFRQAKPGTEAWGKLQLEMGFGLCVKKRN